MFYNIADKKKCKNIPNCYHFKSLHFFLLSYTQQTSGAIGYLRDHRHTKYHSTSSTSSVALTEQPETLRCSERFFLLAG